jgi:hypothetical protein
MSGSPYDPAGTSTVRTFQPKTLTTGAAPPSALAR